MTHAPAPALKLAATPRGVRWLARGLVVGFPAVVAALLLLPWTQNAHGTGRAIAFNPTQRPQFVVSPFEGRVFRWYVVEGQKVKAGQRLVELVDNDPELLRRLFEEENQVEAQLLAVRGQIQAIESRITFLRFAQTSQLAAQRQQVQIAQNEIDRAITNEVAAKATLTQAELDFPRVERLFQKSLETERNYEIARRTLDNAKAAAGAAAILVKNARETRVRADEDLKALQNATDAQVQTENAMKERTGADLTAVERLRLGVESRIERQRQQVINAPTDGTIFRLLANGEAGGNLVRGGDRLAVLVPDIKTAAPPVLDAAVALAGPAGAALTPGTYPGIVAEILVDGNDLPLVTVGDKVRLQFEGWPAVQFVGWPSVAVGTFGGRVYLIDPTTDDKDGRFRLLVEPDPDEADRRPWPDETFLRQGVRVQGWVLFDSVPAWWEVFRQLNGFPATRESKAKSAGSAFGPVVKK